MDPLPEYRWPDLSAIERQYLVRDDQGRYGVGSIDPVYHGMDVMFVRPMGIPAEIGNTKYALPAGAILMTKTAWHMEADGLDHGTWYDYNGIGLVPPQDIRALEIIDDLGYRLPDYLAGRIVNVSASALGKAGGSSTSTAKAAAVRENGKKGGGPRNPPLDLIEILAIMI